MKQLETYIGINNPRELQKDFLDLANAILEFAKSVKYSAERDKDFIRFISSNTSLITGLRQSVKELKTLLPEKPRIDLKSIPSPRRIVKTPEPPKVEEKESYSNIDSMLEEINKKLRDI